MVKVDDKGKALASESEAEKASVKNADTETAASEQVNAQVSSGNSEGEAKKDESNEQVNTKEESNNKNVPASISGGEEKIEENGKVDKILASGSESEHMASIKNVDVETTASGLVNVEGTAAISGGVGNNKEENKKDQSNEKEVDNKLSATGGSSKKRKRKVKKVVKKPSTQSAVTETAASEVVKMDVEAPAAISGGEENKGENKKEDNKVADKTLATKGKKLRNRKKRKTMKGAADLVPAKDTDKPGTSTKEKDTKKSDSMGMIFMCSSKTKEDCYRYKILGLPASKKDMVAKIYKGMRLFLFDIDLKLLYGIYRAAEPGGYNIEPKAFKSAFPSQVRFSVMEDCLPLAEEKFKAVIKDNYYGKNKFDCQLKAEQVKNLCKLFKATTKSRDSKSVGKVPKTEVRTPVDRSRERRQGRDRDRPLVPDRDRRQGRDKDRRQGRDRDESRQGRDRDRRQGRDRDRRQGRGRDRRPELGGGRIVSRADNIYERRALLPPRLPPRLPSPVPQTYAYERPLDMDYYRRDTQLEHHERRLLDFELNRREEMVYREPLVYRDPVPAPEPPLTYHEPLYGRAALPSAHEPPLSYHEPLYTRAAPPVYHLPQLYRY